MRIATILAAVSAISFLSWQSAWSADDPPSEWIEPATGHRVIRLSREPGTASFYFHQNAYTDSGKLIVSTPSGLSTIDLATREITPVVEGRAGGVVVGRKSGHVYYSRAGSIFMTNVDTKQTREIAKATLFGGSGYAVNADETLLGGSFIEGAGSGGGPGQRQGTAEQSPEQGNAGSRDLAPPPTAPQADRPTQGSVPPGQNSAQEQIRQFGGTEDRLARRLSQRLPMKLHTVDIKTGQVNTFAPSTDWLNHVQFSPTDPKLMMFCHEGPWHDVDRIWTIRVDGGEPKLMHPRTMKYEIAGHEFFGHDGKWIWYDLQTPRSGQFWLAGVNLGSGERILYPIERALWSVHYNQSHDGKLFAGDGGGPGSVANMTPLPEKKTLDPPGNGQWIFLFRPASDTIHFGKDTVRIGRFEAEKLVDLSKHNYRLEPNLTFTLDNKWIVFRSNMHGPTHVYAVEVAKAN